MENQANKRLTGIPVGLLKIGMYVAAVDRPWLETPFSVQGFFVESEEDIDFIAANCQQVFIDQQRVRRKMLDTRRPKVKHPKAAATSLKNELRRAEVPPAR